MGTSNRLLIKGAPAALTAAALCLLSACLASVHRAARRAMDAGKEGEALRNATEAQLSAELAVAKSQSAAARKAAEDTLASVETLRKEAARPDQPVSR